MHTSRGMHRGWVLAASLPDDASRGAPCLCVYLLARDNNIIMFTVDKERVKTVYVLIVHRAPWRPQARQAPMRAAQHYRCPWFELQNVVVRVCPTRPSSEYCRRSILVTGAGHRGEDERIGTLPDISPCQHSRLIAAAAQRRRLLP